MPYDPNKHQRRSIRLKGYDYTQAGAYFLTICVYERECRFGEVMDDLVCLNGYRRIAQRKWERWPARFNNIALDAFIVMPNHVHGIILIADQSVGKGTAGVGDANVLKEPRRAPTSRELTSWIEPAVPLLPNNPQNIEQFGKPVPGSIPTIVRSYKSAVSRRIHRLRGTPAGPVWQRNYYEHVVRNEADLHCIQAYIQSNPAHWTADRLHPGA
jgi:putative transposase